jgi:hypothetical protein
VVLAEAVMPHLERGDALVKVIKTIAGLSEVLQKSLRAAAVDSMADVD